MLRLFCYLVITIFAETATAQHKGPARVDYVLSVDTSDLSGYNVEIRIRNAPHLFKLAMATHHEYDDRFWRFIQNFRVTADGNASYVKSDSALWKVSITGKDAVVRYRLHFPPPAQFRFAHRPFLSSTGGLIGDIHSFMYMPDEPDIVSTVTFRLPQTWQIATGLEPTKNNMVFLASSAQTLLDCPVLVGHLHKWPFNINGIRHTIAYLPAANASGFDSMALTGTVKKIVEEVVKIFGSMPYRNYTFLLEDGVSGALEHRNSVTLGAASSMLATNMKELYEQLAHEYFHTWNLMRIKPGEYTPLNYGVQETSAGLWFSEGFTMFYADLILRRAGLPEADAEDSTRLTHLESLISRYYANIGNTMILPGKVSLASNAPPGMLGDYEASVHLQGELFAVMLDLIVRNATDHKKNLDDVMRLMFKRFGGVKGFYEADVEQAVKNICLCDKDVASFFKNHIYEANAIDFDRYLGLAGLQFHLSYAPAANKGGQPAPDLRVYTWQPIGDSFYHIGMKDPLNCWTKAGLHTGDVIFALNNQPVKTRQDFYNLINALEINDTLWVTTAHNQNKITIPVIITGYSIPVAHITQTVTSTGRQRELLNQWEKGN